MEIAIIVIIVALWVLGSMVPTGHTVPQEIASLKRRPRLSLPYSKEIKVMYRIWATWRVERPTPDAESLTQHFEVLKNAVPYCQIRPIP